MADEWPFIHLNTISPHIEPLGGPNELQELSLLPFDPSHLEAWTNITFRFDEPNSLFNNPTTATETQNPNSTQFLLSSPTLPTTSDSNINTDLAHDLFHTSPEMQFQPPTDSKLHPFVDSSHLTSKSSHTQQLIYLDSTSNQPTRSTSDHRLDGSLNNTIETSTKRSTMISHSSIESHNQSIPSKTLTNSHQVEDHGSSLKYDPTSPNNHATLSNHSSNDDDVDNRIAHDEDKRRRNTLASARFRMKKKMKEQEIERTAREMRDRVSELEKEVDNLKQENKWLRGLIVDSTASKLVSAQTKEAAGLNLVESHSIKKRPSPTLALEADSMRATSYPQKRHKMISSPTSTASHSTTVCNFSPPPLTR